MQRLFLLLKNIIMVKKEPHYPKVGSINYVETIFYF